MTTPDPRRSRYPAAGVVDPDPTWPARYERLSQRLRTALGGWTTEHIGSTSVPGLPAKPVIDIAVRVPSGGTASGRCKDLVAAGWTEPFDLGSHDCSFLLDGDVRVAIAHFVPADQWDEVHQRLFAAWLREHPDDRDEYARVKLDLRAAGVWGREYTRAKTQVVQRVVDRARAARGLAPVPVWDKDR